MRSATRTGCFIPTKKHRYRLNRRLGGPQSGSGRFAKVCNKTLKVTRGTRLQLQEAQKPLPLHVAVNYYYYYYYYYYYLLQLSFHSLAAVLTLVTNKNKYT